MYKRGTVASALVAGAAWAILAHAPVAVADPADDTDQTQDQDQPGRKPSGSMPNLNPPQSGGQDHRLSTGGWACVDGVRTYVPPEGLTMEGPHDFQPYRGQC